MVIFTMTCLVPFIHPSFSVPHAKEFEAREEVTGKEARSKWSAITTKILEVTRAKEKLVQQLERTPARDSTFLQMAELETQRRLAVQ